MAVGIRRKERETIARNINLKRKDRESSLRDSDTGAVCVNEKAVEITEDCPGANEKKRAVLVFTRVKRGSIVQIYRPDKDETYDGKHVHFFVNELEHEMHAPPKFDSFGAWAMELGLTKDALRTLIEAHAPA